MISHNWGGVGGMRSRSYVCGYCGQSLASQLGYSGHTGDGKGVTIYICHYCTQPTYFDSTGGQFPGDPFGDEVKDIADEGVAALYQEARRSYSATAYTAAVLCCRKLLMHVAVAKGAKAGLGFVEYVQYLTDNHYVPPDAKEWVDHIRRVGNEANHEIVQMSAGSAEELISFSGMLLKVIYEFPAVVARKKQPEASS